MGSRYDFHPNIGQSEAGVREELKQPSSCTQIGTISCQTDLFVSSVFSKSILQHSLTSSPTPVSTPALQPFSSPATYDDELITRSRRDSQAPDPRDISYYEQSMMHHKPLGPAVGIWDDCVSSASGTTDSFFGFGSSRPTENEPADSGGSVETPKSLIRVILCRCRSNKELYTFCRQVSKSIVLYTFFLRSRPYRHPHYLSAHFCGRFRLTGSSVIFCTSFGCSLSDFERRLCLPTSRM